MLYLYTLADSREHVGASLRGLDGAAVAVVACNGIVAVVSDVDQAPIRPTPERLWQHEQVVEAVMRRATAVPARFATTFAGKDALDETIHAARDAILHDFQRLSGCLELSLRVLRMGDPSSHGEGRATAVSKAAAKIEVGTATAPTRVRREPHHRPTVPVADEVAELNQALSSHAEEHLVCGGEGHRLILKASYLVRRDRIEAMQQVVQQLVSAYPGLHFVCTGPWPPYNFVRWM